jgi:hypothetical protein
VGNKITDDEKLALEIGVTACKTIINWMLDVHSQQKTSVGFDDYWRRRLPLTRNLSINTFIQSKVNATMDGGLMEVNAIVSAIVKGL